MKRADHVQFDGGLTLERLLDTLDAPTVDPETIAHALKRFTRERRLYMKENDEHGRWTRLVID